jgi:hypothetical protein
MEAATTTAIVPTMSMGEMPAAASHTGLSSVMSSMMSNTFDTSTTVTLLFSGWTTRNPLQYFSALAFLFALTLLNRFLGAWRAQLSKVWANQAARARLERSQKARLEKLGRRSSRSNWEKRGGAGDDELALLSPATAVEDGDNDCHHGSSTSGSKDDDPTMVDVEAGLLSTSASVPGPAWTRFLGSGVWHASNPYRWKIDGPRSVLEFVRALIGYVL